ncbi:GNAT family N-acetyltransferase [Actinomadura barringtoniae]|uniref:GNAT family N-acetyltransferase n=1 Tax=Actinomadura barringtoniae TaxID=1427535 RepID=A0A939TAL6_9ACTN|nr:GNAT family N-acetyltransferase [Actinomadura barringtoniae]MBO2455544.1 GNAT family N-acetyltransferase [Actinomadura barringtoniae]
MGNIRQPRPDDHTTLIAAIEDWWADSRTPEEARELSRQLPKLFLKHFAGTSLLMEGDAGVEGFLIGFHSADHSDESYIHVIGVHPDKRKDGVARELYEHFFEKAAAAGRTRVRAITSPRNKGSIAFHRSMGFTLEDGDQVVDGVPIHIDYDGPGEDRVSFRRTLP